MLIKINSQKNTLRLHQAETLSNKAKEALEKANVTLEDIDVIGCTYGPGLVGALLVGVAEAKAMIESANNHLAGLKKEDIPTNFLKHYASYKAGQMNLSELARVCELSRPTIYKYLKLV